MRLCVIALMLCLAGCSTEEPGPKVKPVDQKSAGESGTATDGLGGDETGATPAPTQRGEFLSAIQGKWEIVEANLGKAVIADMKGGTAEITGNGIVVTTGGRQNKSTMEVDEGTDPVQFQSVSQDGMRMAAIMKFEGNELIVCVSLVPGSEYPSSFAPDPNVMVVRYKRPE